MNESDLKKNLNTLKSIKPRQSWKKASRDFLLSEIRSTAGVENVRSEEKGFFLYFQAAWSIFREKTMQPASLLLVLFGLVLASTLTVNAAFYSLPGNSLYRVKIALERTQLAMVRDDTKAAELRAELANKRLDEFEKIVASQGDKPEVRKAKVAAAVKQFKKEIESAKNKVEKLTPSSDETDDKVFQIALSVDSVTSKLVESLNEQEKDLSDDDSQEVKKTVEELSESLTESLQKKLDSLTQEVVALEGQADDLLKIIEVTQGYIDEKKTELALDNLSELRKLIDEIYEQNNQEEEAASDETKDSEKEVSDTEKQDNEQESDVASDSDEQTPKTSTGNEENEPISAETTPEISDEAIGETVELST